MTFKEKRQYVEDLMLNEVSQIIGGSLTKLCSKNKKLYKDFIKKDSVFSLYVLNYVKPLYYSWVVDDSDRTLDKNFDRLIYLLNANYELCLEMFKDEPKPISDFGYNENQKIQELKDYRELLEGVGL